MAKVSVTVSIKARWWLPEMLAIADIALMLGADTTKLTSWIARYGYRIEVK